MQTNKVMFIYLLSVFLSLSIVAHRLCHTFLLLLFDLNAIAIVLFVCWFHSCVFSPLHKFTVVIIMCSSTSTWFATFSLDNEITWKWAQTRVFPPTVFRNNNNNGYDYASSPAQSINGLITCTWMTASGIRFAWYTMFSSSPAEKMTAKTFFLIKPLENWNRAMV